MGTTTLRKVAVLSLVLVLAGALLAGAAGQPEEEVVVRDEIVIAMGAEPEALDPVAMTSAPAATVSEHVSQPLIYMEEDGTLAPLLATDWYANEDGDEWTLELREGVTFHDGEPFNAEAVKANLERFLDPDVGAAYAFLINRIQEMEVVDEHTLRLYLDAPFAPMASHLSHSFVAMISPAQIAELDDPDDITDAPIGTGPYRFVEWDRGSSITVEVNEDYWGDIPEIPRVRFNFIEEDSARMVALETGEADVVMRVPPVDADRLAAEPDIDVVYQTSVRQIYIGFNAQAEPFDDPRVRRAFNYAVDKESIVADILRDNAFVADAPIPDAVFGHTSVGPYEHDPDRARELLAEAGYEDGISFTLYHPTGRYLLDSTIAEAVQAQLAQVGLDASLQTLEWGSYIDMLDTPLEDAEHEVYMLGWGTVTLDADYGLYALLHSSQAPPVGNNYGFYGHDEVDELLADARVIPDVDQREAMYHEAIELLWEDAPWLFLHNEGQINAQRANVEGVIHHPLENVSVWNARFGD